ncbi:MAG: hypothetical protein U0575_10560 [Phycisphaerales bacterium]
MLVYCGIDEAGYGPMLGPLCVAATAFEVMDHDPASGAPDLWSRLSQAVCRRPGDRRRRVAVDDSKKLKGANDAAAHPLRHLERGVLAFLASRGELPRIDAAMFAALDVAMPSTASAPWCDGATLLPLVHEPEQLEIAAAQLRRAAEGGGARCVHMACEAIDVGAYNERLAIARNKASVNFDAVVRHVDRLWRRFPEAHPRVVIDRQGGRIGYREPLALCFPDATVAIVAETERISRYRLERGGAAITLSFEAESEAAHLPAALASMVAKYVRELWMIRFNRWFAARRPGVRPTAGYVQDGRRWLGEMEGLISELAIPRDALVRRA